ncbi:MAG: hypothetical protein AUK47_21975 [Deltaproteobacteria bacterium CG2_30_63_29]|nr:MAG: hypothetical protein AUK47_21975 [Deltaproteobacteria bacterium CG2_30_63_29]PIV98276.1 MAG: hypothetical protein COW42_15630 [Deltaproteobacteria bacterium CG17_big_fil_post_rev_8_21_14_2_50_63_7]PJB40424.1 MAG: hypothetical protein CO108_14745 [Deltaproteobacteria bacterium CG_4_9_14_3_um_filter_63_12]
MKGRSSAWATTSGSDFFLERGRDVLHRPQEVPLDAMLAILRQDAPWRPRDPLTRPSTPGRNSPCSCGSGRKYKACCAHKESREGVVFRRKPKRRSK